MARHVSKDLSDDDLVTLAEEALSRYAIELKELHFVYAKQERSQLLTYMAVLRDRAYERLSSVARRNATTPNEPVPVTTAKKLD